MIGVTILAIALALLKKLGVLVLGIAAYCWVRRGRQVRGDWRRLAVEATLFSLMVIDSMISGSMAFKVMTDARYVLLPLATIFSGPVVGATVTVSIIATRIYLGGAGMLAGIIGAISVMIVSAAVWYRFTRLDRLPSLLDLFWISLVAMVAAMIGRVFLPWDAETMTAVLESEIAMLLVNPIAMMAFGSLILWDERLKRLRSTGANENARFRALINNLPLSLAIRTLDGKVTLLNRRYEELHGPDIMRFIGKDRSELRAALLSPQQQVLAERDEEALRNNGLPISRLVDDITISGQAFSVLITNFGIRSANDVLQSIGTVGVDISELREREKQTLALQAQLVQAAKMEAIGQLARGVAHDFSNLLVGIFGFSGFLVEDLADQPTLQNYALRITKICERASALVQQIQSFAGAENPSRETIDLANVIDDTRDVLRTRLPPTTELVYDLGHKPLLFDANEGQISRLVTNLCVNASDALNGGRGRVSVSLAVVNLSEEIIRDWFEAKPSRVVSSLPIASGTFIRIEVRDTGSGIEPETLQRIMDPFFTTKGRTEGTGLGLWIVDGIVHAYRGCYAIDSTIGVGTAFAVYLPYEQRPQKIEQVDARPALSRRPIEACERILVVDDQQDILDVFMIGLRRLGRDRE